jgi:phage FluMu gp28-like protein
MSALPAVFCTYQQELMSSAAHYPITFVEKSRRTGYSWGAGAIAVMTAAASRAAGGMNVYYMGYEKEMTREFINYCGEWAGTLQVAASAFQEQFFSDPDHPEKQLMAFRCELDSGFEIVALPSVARALRGKQGLVIIDEAAFIDDLEGVLKAAIALLMWGGRILVISTHNGEENYFNKIIHEIRAGKKPYHLLRCTLDDALEQGLYQRIAAKLGLDPSPAAQAAWRAKLIAQYGDKADEELFCIPSEGGGAALPRVLIEKRMVVKAPVLRWKCSAEFLIYPPHIKTAEALAWCEKNLLPELLKLDPELASVFGEDFGRKKDLTVFVPAQIQRNLVRRVPFIVELRNVPFDQQREILFYMVDRLPRFRAGKLDAGGNGSYLAEKALERYGETRIECVMLSDPWYRENMPKLVAAFTDGTIELPIDAEVLEDFAHLALVRGVVRVPERTFNSEGDGRHGDAAIAAAMMIAASHADVEFYEYQGPVAQKTKAQREWDGEDDDDRRGEHSSLFGGLRGSAFNLSGRSL